MNKFEESLELYSKEETHCLREALADFKNSVGKNVAGNFIMDSPAIVEKLNKVCSECFRLGFYSGIDFSEKFM